MGHSQSSSTSSTPISSRSRSSTTNNNSNFKPTIDGGYLEPQSHLYATSLQEFNQKSVSKLILDKRLAPFYLGLNEFELEWNLEELIKSLEESELQSIKNLKEALIISNNIILDLESNSINSNTNSNTSTPTTTTSNNTKKSKESLLNLSIAILHRDKLIELNKFKEKFGLTLPSIREEQAKLYLGKAIECPICFLYYPPPLVNTRCCDQPICTECFVQIKRLDPTATHLESEPASCPFCCESNFGVVYIKESGRPNMASLTETNSNTTSTTPVTLKPKIRRKSFAHTEKEVVTTDHIHPDWESKVEAIKATVARRANRRIVFRQVGDRLVPVGVTSGRSSDGSNITMTTNSLPSGFAAQVAAAFDSSNNISGGGSGGTGGGRESRRAARKRNAEMTSYLESIGMGVGPDLEEMMVLEALRLSMIDDEERQKKLNATSSSGVGGIGGESGNNNDSAISLSEEAETSIQGALRNNINNNNNFTTAGLLADAMDEPMGLNNNNNSTSTRNGKSISRNNNNINQQQQNPLPNLPLLIPTLQSTISSSQPLLSSSPLSTSSSSPSISTSISSNSNLNPIPSPQLDLHPPPPSPVLTSLNSTLEPLATVTTSEEILNSQEGSVVIQEREGYESLASPQSIL